MGCLFGAGITAHVLLVAGLRNPTVRGRYAAVRELADHGIGDFHETLLELLGSHRISAERATAHVTALSEVFEAACGCIRSSFEFAADIQEFARPAAIDGSLEMIERGNHREAMFWIGVTWRRCMTVLTTDAPDRITQHFRNAFREVLSDLGLSSDAQVRQRGIQIEQTLPRVCGVAEQIIGSLALTIRPGGG